MKRTITAMQHEVFMQRCFDLARLGAGHVSPNPMVGAVLVHEGRIIGEGWHRRYGQAHAEVHAIESVKEEDRHLIEKATLYVSLEPCCTHGNTPACTGLIIQHKIPRVVISCLDQTPNVNGWGVMALRKADVEVVTKVLEKEGQYLSRFRNTFVSKNRPYVLLKFAQSRDGFMGKPGQQVWISNQFSNRLTHRLRAEYDAFLIGTNTAITDNAQLTNRLWFGKNPIRIVLDRQLKIPTSNAIFDSPGKTLVVTEQEKAAENDSLKYIKVPFDHDFISNLLGSLFHENITSLVVEGGAATLQSFIEAGCWDEALVITGNRMLREGIVAPKVPGFITEEQELGDDALTIYRRDK